MRYKTLFALICVMSFHTIKSFGEYYVYPDTTINNIHYKIEDKNAIVWPKAWEEVGYNAVPNDWAYGDIVIPDSISYRGSTYKVIKIRDYCFKGNKNITSVTIGDNVEQIGSSAFDGCENLTSVKVGDGLKYFDQYVFRSCYNLKTVVLGRGLENLYNYTKYSNCGWVFEKCKKIERIISMIDRIFSFNSDEFPEEVYYNAQLLVPLGQRSKYKNVRGWSKFFYIEERDFLSKHKLTYLVDGLVYKQYELGYDEETIIPDEQPAKEGYSFSGWSYIPDRMPANDVNITGMMIPQKYQATFIVDGETYSTTEVDYGSSITLPEMPEKEGYTFSWIDVPATMPAHDITIKGYYTVNQYNLTYYVDGQKYKTFELDYGTVITPEERLEKEGYTFYGWSDIPATMPAHDVSVTGRFVVNQYQITYMVDFTIFYSEMLDFGATITPPEVPNKEGYDFSWSDIPDKMPAHNLTIHGFYTSGILSILIDNSRMAIYQTNGRKTKKLHHGVNIIKDSKGKVKKIIN